jgi:hypothetical protein
MAVEPNAPGALPDSSILQDLHVHVFEGLRWAMLAYMNDTTNPLNAYPALWAPFVVVGEGAAR